MQFQESIFSQSGQQLSAITGMFRPTEGSDLEMTNMLYFTCARGAVDRSPGAFPPLSKRAWQGGQRRPPRTSLCHRSPKSGDERAARKGSQPPSQRSRQTRARRRTGRSGFRLSPSPRKAAPSSPLVISRCGAKPAPCRGWFATAELGSHRPAIRRRLDSSPCRCYPANRRFAGQFNVLCGSTETNSGSVPQLRPSRWRQLPGRMLGRHKRL